MWGLRGWGGQVVLLVAEARLRKRVIVRRLDSMVCESWCFLPLDGM